MHFNLLDYIIIGILLLSMLTGLRQGLVNALGGILSSLLALLLAFVYYNDCALLAEKSFGLTGIISEFIRQKVPILTISPNSGILGHGLFELPLINDPASYIAQLVVPALSFLFLFVISSLLLKLVFEALNSLFSFGVLGWVNRVLGMALVLLKNMLIMTLLTGVLSPLVYMAARIGWAWGITASGYMANSLLLARLMAVFVFIKTAAGINA